MSTYNCVNCRLNFYEQVDYKQHYKSEHHRYNVKRRLIGLTPLSNQQFLSQFQNQLSSKSSTQKELHCELCSKKFLSPQTYKQHLNSQKHKNNRKKITSNTNKSADEKSQTSSCSQFSIIGQKQKPQCLFCPSLITKQHMKKQHNFPPFADQCTNIDDLINQVKSEIADRKCVFCLQVFQSEESAKQHMMEVGHAKLDLHNFARFEKFYLWKIEQTSSDDDDFEQFNENYVQEHYQQIKKETLQSLEQKRQNRVKLTNTGYKINGKEVGARCMKNYYKQYLGRDIPENPYRAQLALECEQWKQTHKKRQLPCKFQKLPNVTAIHR